MPQVVDGEGALIAERRQRGPRFSGEDLMQVFEVSSDLVCLCEGGRIHAVNSAGTRILGAADANPIIGREFVEFLAIDYVQSSEEFLENLMHETDPLPVKLARVDGGEAGVTITLFRARELGPEANILIARDITHELRLSRAVYVGVTRYRKLAQNALDLICVCEGNRVTYINAAGLAMLGARHAAEVEDRPFAGLFHRDFHEVFAHGIKNLIMEDRLFPARLARLDGTYLDVELAVIPFDGMIANEYMVEARDITRHNRAVAQLHKMNTELERRVRERTRELAHEVEVRKQAEERLRHLASHDGLTGLPNRRLLMELLETAIRRAHRDNSKLAVLFIDLDGFKAVNDTLGHDAGDLLLKEVADRLTGAVRETDAVARLGGDEFVVVVTDVKEEAAMSRFSKKILDLLSHPVSLGEREAFIGGSIGIALYPDNSSSGESLVKRADEAMYVVKQRGKGGYHLSSRRVR